MADCDNPRDPFAGSGRSNEGGFLAVHKQDFNAHHSGGAFRHCANNIDMGPIIDAFPGADVQETLELIALAIGTPVDIDDTYVTIGDGYKSSGDFNVGDVETPTFEDAITAALAENRLSDGGIILIKAGEYVVENTITIPAGIKLMGEPTGVVIVGQTNDDPIFSIGPADNDISIGGSPVVTLDDPNYTTFFNLTLADNINNDSGFNTTLPSSTMIECQAGCYAVIDKVTFIGKVNNSKVATYRGVATSGTSTTPTRVYVRNSFFSGMSVPISYEANLGGNDILSLNNNRFYFLGKTAAGEENQSGIVFSPVNVDITNNRFFGDNTNYYAGYALYVKNIAVSSVGRYNFSGNTGGLSGSSVNIVSSFLNNNATSAYKGSAFGNQWGQSKTDWYVSVGDGVTSTGDIVGTNALDLIMSSTLDWSLINKFTIIVNPGTYTMSNQHGTAPALTWNIIGNYSQLGNRPEIRFNSDVQNQFYFSGNIQNIKFANDGAQSCEIVVTGSNTKTTYTNCFFENIVFSLSRNAEFYSCIFERLERSFDDLFTIVINNSLTDVKLDGCNFIGLGYGIQALGPGIENLVINDCDFDQYNGSDFATNGYITTNIASTGNSSYIYVKDVTNLVINNTKIQGVPDNIINSNSYRTVDPTIVSIAGYERFVHIEGVESVTLDNVTVLAPGGEYLNTYNEDGSPEVVFSGLCALFLRDVQKKIQLSNSNIRGMLPVQITGENSFPEQGYDMAKISILNNFIGAHDADASVVMNCSTMLNIDLPPFITEMIGNRGSIEIDGNDFQNRQDPATSLYPKMEAIEAVNPTFIIYSGGINIHAVGWGIKVNNNGIICQTKAGPAFELSLLNPVAAGSDSFTYGVGALAIVNGSFYSLELNMLSDTSDAECAITSNKIKMINGDYTNPLNGTNAANVFATVLLSSGNAVINSNLVRFDSRDNISSDYLGGEASGSFIWANGGLIPGSTSPTLPPPHEGGIIISDNVFGHNRDGLPIADPLYPINSLQNSAGNLNRHSIYIGNEAPQGQIFNNVFEWVYLDDSTSPNRIIIDSSRSWTIGKNKNSYMYYYIRGHEYPTFWYSTSAYPANKICIPLEDSGAISSIFFYQENSAALSSTVVTWNASAPGFVKWIVPLNAVVDDDFFIRSLGCQWSVVNFNNWRNAANSGPAVVNLYLVDGTNNILLTGTSTISANSGSVSTDYIPYGLPAKTTDGSSQNSRYNIVLEIDARDISAVNNSFRLGMMTISGNF